MSPRRSSAATRAQTRALADHIPAVVDGLFAEVAAPAVPHGSPAVVVLMGFPGVGKSHCARLLARRLGAVHVASDQLRSQLFVAASYVETENAAVFRILDALVERLVASGHRVIVDATHLSKRTRAGTLVLASRMGVPCTQVLITSEEGDTLARLAQRRQSRAEDDRSEADERVYQAMRERGFEAPDAYLVLRNGPDLASEIERTSRDLEARWSAT